MKALSTLIFNENHNYFFRLFRAQMGPGTNIEEIAVYVSMNFSKVPIKGLLLVKQFRS